jgi:hypothetical protein
MPARRTSGHRLIAVLACTLVVPAHVSARVWFVDASRPGGDGSTWVLAFKHLQDALAVPPSAGDEIWVAAGTYWPDRDRDDPGGTGVRTASFVLVDGTLLLGGFAGNETTRGDRDPMGNETVLAGDIAVAQEDHSVHVVTSAGDSSATFVDGFTVTEGFADAEEGGGGLLCMETEAFVVRCLFTGNTATRMGSAVGEGGAVYVFRASAEPPGENEPTFINCRFIGNVAEAGGGLSVAGMANVHIYNSLFRNNEVDGNGTPFPEGTGGAIFVGEAELKNCTIVENHADDRGGGIGGPTTGAIVIAENCIFWGNTDDDSFTGVEEEQISIAPSTIELDYSTVEGCDDHCAGAPDDSSDGLDPHFIDAAGDDFRLAAASAAMDAGYGRCARRCVR